VHATLVHVDIATGLRPDAEMAGLFFGDERRSRMTIQTLWGEFDSMEQLQNLRPVHKRPIGLPDWTARQSEWYDWGIPEIPLADRYQDFCRRLSAKTETP
jgi:hypothetical protein